MDPLTDLLNGVRSTGALFTRSALSGAWSVRFDGGVPLALVVILRDAAWVVPQEGDPVRLGAGDVAVLSGGAPYTIAGNPDVPPEFLEMAGEGAVLVSGLYSVDSGMPGRLLAALPPLAVVPAGQGSCPVTTTAFEDAARPGPGRQVLLDRMLDLMLITALRAWFTRPGAEVPAWYRAAGDPVVGSALRLMDVDLAHPWTVESLAAKSGVSRAALARRFAALVGQPPMSYLREQRIALAADLLREPGVTIAAVASRVGFSSAFALSAAFKKVRGVSPSEHRTHVCESHTLDL